MHSQSIMIELALPEFTVQRTVTDSRNDLLVIVKANSLPTCPDCAGAEVVKREARIGLPDENTLALAKERALANGVELAFLAELEDGLTGTVGIWEPGLPGPKVALRYDMDALQVLESEGIHLPAQNGFRSEYEGMMHARGHDSGDLPTGGRRMSGGRSDG